MLKINKKQLREIIDPSTAMAEIEKSFVAFSTGKVILPLPLVFDLPKNNGEICIKTALVEGLPTYTVKIVSVFKSNENVGLPTLTAVMNIFDSATGKLLAVLNEEGWLTALRTACAGVLVDRYFRKKLVSNIGVAGLGVQAKFLIKMILEQNKGYKKVCAWDIRQEKILAFINEMQKQFPEVIFSSCPNIDELTEESDTILTATPAKEPFLILNGRRPGLTIIAIGADMPDKCEISPQSYAKADKIFVDSIESNLVLGGIAKSLKQGKIFEKNIAGEIGEVFCGAKQGRINDNEFIIVSLVGVGVQDSFIGNLAYKSFLDRK
ncbi:MAG: ornithine cyclodeaminase family protein [Candidatus Pacebacteria bacterium]|nr:ornithine cyclodeaminase family protein [Candidatus Paceibacterota bacterium]